MPYGPHCFWAGGMWLMPLVCLSGMILVAVILFFVLRGGCCGWTAGSRRLPDSGEDALNILKKRYAKGEVSKEQFEQMKKDLQE